MPEGKAVVDEGRLNEIDLVSAILGVKGERGVGRGGDGREGGGSGVGREGVEEARERLANGSSSIRKAGGGELLGEVTAG